MNNKMTLDQIITKIGEARKAAAGACGSIATIVATGVLPDKLNVAAGAVLAVATALGIYAVPNDVQSKSDPELAE